jgi:uracil-DNA glycosylase family 4
MNLVEQIKNCDRCPLNKWMPDGCKPVPGIGPIGASIMIVGEALGEDESILEEPFVGQCGQLLNKILKEAGLQRELLFITNTVKCRPTEDGKKNRAPTKIEIKSCHDWLSKEIELVKPKIIVPLGKVASFRLLKGQIKSNFTLGTITGQIFNLSNMKVIPAQHPSWLMQYGKAELQRTIDIFKMIKLLSEAN